MNSISTEIKNGAVFTSFKENKFKTQCISISFLTELNRETVSMCSILPRVLYRGTGTYSTMKEIQEACDELFGARITPFVRKKGEILAIGFYADCLTPAYTIGHSDPMEKVIDILSDILLNPITNGGMLSREYVDSEKQKLLEDIEARRNDKDDFASYNAVKEMCCFESYGIDELGDEETLGSFDYVDISTFYKKLLSESPVEIYYNGPSGHSDIASILSYSLMALPRGEINYEISTDIRMNSVNEKARRVSQFCEVSQTRLILGYRLGECMSNPNIPAILIFNAMLGNGVNSLLFRKLRTENAICYDVSSSVDCIKGILLVRTGIDYNNLDAAEKMIENSIRDIAELRIEEKDFKIAVETICASIASTDDDQSGLEDFYITSLLEGTGYTTGELAAACRKATMHEIADIASSLEADIVYYMAPEECEELEHDRV